MKYEKPEIVNVASAVSAIQGGKNTSGTFDGNPPPDSYTKNAYEADE